MLARSVSYWDESMDRMLHPHVLVKLGLGPTWCLTTPALMQLQPVHGPPSV